MNIHFNILNLQFKNSREILDLTKQVSFFYGMISSGKSSIARIIDFCLGGDLEKTPAITKEFLSATLDLNIGTNHVLLERTISSNMVQCTWYDATENTASVLAPVIAGGKVIYAESIYNLSDLIFYLAGFDPVKIPSNRNLDDAKLARLSIRNLMWYCYLDQHHLDSSFFRLEDPMKRRNSRGVLKYVLQFASENLNQLEADFIQTRDEKTAKMTTVAELNGFLGKVGFSSAGQIEKEIAETNTQLEAQKKEKSRFEKGYRDQTHASDSTRQNIHETTAKIIGLQNSQEDLAKRIEEQTSLKAELISAKFKMARTDAVKNILSGVVFTSCPSCGTDVSKRMVNESTCKLCTSPIGSPLESESTNAEIVRLDLDSRIKDIEDSLVLHKSALSKQKRQVYILVEKKKEQEAQLNNELKTYESTYLSNIRTVDRQVATLEERIKGFKRLRQFPTEITKLEELILVLAKKEEQLKKQIIEEKTSLTSAEQYIKDLEATFLETLITIGIPGVSEGDSVIINRTTWEPLVVPLGDPESAWNFHNAGSGGKKTLFNVCFMLSLHIVASRNNLPLPNFMIIDTPMKNIDKEINEDIFKRFYDYLYKAAVGELDNTQIILIDNSFVAPAESELTFYSRYMTPNDDNNPPLITYYRGA